MWRWPKGSISYCFDSSRSPHGQVGDEVSTYKSWRNQTFSLGHQPFDLCSGFEEPREEGKKYPIFRKNFFYFLIEKSFFLLKYSFICLAVWDLGCGTQDPYCGVGGCEVRGSAFSAWGLTYPLTWGSLSSPTRERTQVLCTARQSLNH